MAFDVRTAFRQEGLEDGPRCLLVKPVFGRRRVALERFFQERHANPLGAAHLNERLGRPRRLALDHLSEQSQANADHLALFRQTGDAVFQER